MTDQTGCSAVDSITLEESPPVVLEIQSTDATCGDSNGRIEVAASGGTAPYTYQWSTGATTSSINELPAGDYWVAVQDSMGCFAFEYILISESNSPNLELTKQDVTCQGQNGAATALASGMGLNFTYAWSTGETTPDIDSLRAGFYIVTVSDESGCRQLGMVLIEDNSLRAAIPDFEPATCDEANGSAVAVAEGGVEPYTYQWSNGTTTAELTGVEPGEYTLVVTDSTGCQASATVEIPEIPGPTLSVEAVNPLCGETNGSALVSATGGAEPYTYLWNTGQDSAAIGGLGAGEYTVTVQDANGCEAVAAVTVEEEKLEIEISTVLPSCGGADGVVMATVNGGSGTLQYEWNTGSTESFLQNLLPGTYTVTVTDETGCSAIDSITLEESSPVILEIQSTDATCGDSNGRIEVAASGGTAPYTYQWSTGATTSSINELPAGDYWVAVQDSLGCFAFEYVLISESNSPDLELTKQDVTCEDLNGSATALASGMGLNFTYAWSTGETTPDIDSLRAGFYVVTVSDESGCRQLGMVLIENNSLRAAIPDFGPATCNEANGSAVALAEGGVEPYTYQWSNGAATADLTGVEPGEYMVVVTDSSGCQASATVEIPEIPGPVLSTEVAGTTCGEANGSAGVSVSGAAEPFTILWSNGDTSAMITGLEAGEYTVLVADQAGCASEATVLVEPSTPLAVNLGDDIVTCPDSAVSLTAVVAGGAGDIRFVWSTGDSTETIIVNPTEETVYTVVVTDPFGCSADGEVTVRPDVAICDGACLITAELIDQVCDDNDTPDDAGDDLYTAIVKVSATNGGAGWMLGNGTTGAYGEEVALGPFFIAGGTLKFKFTDAGNSDCFAELEINPPTACSEASSPPVVSCPLGNHFCPIVEEDIMLFGTTDPAGCNADIRIPLPEITATSEACDDFAVNITVSDTLGNTIAVFGDNDARLIGNLGIGDYIITYTVQDICGNVVQQDCRFRVADLQAPTTVCLQALNVSIGGGGIATLPASTFDVGSVDNCGIEKVEVRRQLSRDPLFCSELPTPIYSPWDTEVDFTCCDVNEVIMVEIRVVDFSGNENICWLEVNVEDKTAPLCYGLEDVTVACDSLPEGFDPADIAQLQEYFGMASVFDNCNAGVTELEPVLEFSDPCNGTITRTFAGLDIFGNESEPFVQVITIQGSSANLIGIVKGALSTMNNKAIEGVEMNLSGAHYDLTSSSPTGQFSFEKLKLESNYRVTPFLDKDHRMGVSTIDLIMLNQYLLGAYEFRSPFQYIAADVNSSGVVTVLDLFELRSLLLGNTDRFLSNTSWRFVDLAYNFVEPNNPWFETFPESADIHLQKRPVMAAHFTGIKIGDIDGSANASSIGAIVPRNNQGVFHLSVEDRLLDAGQVHVIPVTAAGLEQILGYQASWRLDTESLELVEIRDGIVKQEHFGFGQAPNGIVTNSWHELEKRSFSADGTDDPVMFTLVVKAKANIWLQDALHIDSRSLQPEAYHMEQGVFDVALNFTAASPESVANTDLALWQNEPNPFRGQTVIGFSLPQEGRVNLVVSDITGRPVRRLEGMYQSGYHEFTVDAHDLSSGIYFYKLNWNDRQLVRKMVIQK